MNPSAPSLRIGAFSVAVLLFAAGACSPSPQGDAPPDSAAAPPDEASAGPSASATGNDAAEAAPAARTGRWEMVSSGEGDGLFFGVTEGEPGVVHIFCPAGGGMLVNVNAFDPVGSEERMSFGSGGEVVTLVADAAGDANRGGVSGEGPVPANLRALLTGPPGLSVNYGTQNVGPLVPVPDATAAAFARGCSD